MDGPQSRRQSAQLNSFDAALLDESDGVLKIVVSILGPVRRKDSAGKIWLSIDGLDDTHFVSPNFDQRYGPAEESFSEGIKKVQAGLEHVSLDSDFAFGGHHASRRHAASEIASFLDRNFTRPDVHKDATQDDDQHNQQHKADNQLSVELKRHRCS
jgi:hypothetical protein